MYKEKIVCLLATIQRKHTEIGRMNQWLLDLFNRIELLDACAKNRFRGSLKLGMHVGVP